MSKRACIFCGQPPEAKNKEHVIPKWLFRATGKLTRNISLGFDYDTGKERTWSANGFQFPACASCNTKYSSLESAAQHIVMNVVANRCVCCGDVTTLLDWFDKVRVGLWLGLNHLNSKSIRITPSFYIDDRVGTKDRALYIYRLPTNGARLSLMGLTMPLFWVQPSCFALLINDIVFVNFSYDCLFAKNAGFPYLNRLERLSSGKLEGTLSRGNEQVNWPLSDLIQGTVGLAIHQICMPGAKDIASVWHHLRCIKGNAFKSLPLVKSQGVILAEFERNFDSVWQIPTIEDEPNFSWEATALLVIAIQEHLFNNHCCFTGRQPNEAESRLYRIHRRTHDDLFFKLTGPPEKAEG